MYDLRVDGLRDLARRKVIRTRKVYRDPLTGVLNGVNVVFRSTYYPIGSSGSMFLHDSSGSPMVAAHSVDYDTGTVTFVSAPSSQPMGTYVHQPLTDGEMVDLLISGFDEMQGRWHRPFYLSSNASTYAVATGSEAHIYIVTRDGNSVADPASGARTFSAERVQIGLYMLCCDLAFLQDRSSELAVTAFRFREERGPLVDQSRMPSNVERAVDRLSEKIKRALDIAYGQYYGSEAPWGGYARPVTTAEYEDLYDWQTERREAGSIL